MFETLQHLQENWVFYAIATIVGGAFLYYTRQYVVPIVFHILEMAVYTFLFHTAVSGVTQFASWYQEEAFIETEISRFATRDRVFGLEAAAEPVPQYFTPYVEFWNRELYHPDWLYSMELTVVCFIILAVALFRPLSFSAGPGYRPQGKGSRSSEPPERAARYGESRTDQNQGKSRRR